MHQRLEHVGDARARALDGEQVEAAAVGIAAEQFGDQVGPHQRLGLRQHAHRQGVVVAEDTVDPLGNEPVRIEAVDIAREVDAARQQRATGDARPFGQKGVQPCGDAALARQATDAGAGRHVLRFAEREGAEQHAGRTRLEHQPVRVAAPGIEHQALAPVLGEFDQPVLQFERAQAFEAALFILLHGAPFGSERPDFPAKGECRGRRADRHRRRRPVPSSR